MRERVAIVVADFNKAIVGPMIESACDELHQQGLALAREVMRVTGSFEIPLIADAILGRDDVDAVVVLGYIEKGETLHGEVMGHVVYSALVDLQLAYGKPVGIGIIGPGATAEQAEVRKDPAARAAVRAVQVSLACLASLRDNTSQKPAGLR